MTPHLGAPSSSRLPLQVNLISDPYQDSTQALPTRLCPKLWKLVKESEVKESTFLQNESWACSVVKANLGLRLVFARHKWSEFQLCMGQSLWGEWGEQFIISALLGELFTSQSMRTGPSTMALSVSTWRYHPNSNPSQSLNSTAVPSPPGLCPGLISAFSREVTWTLNLSRPSFLHSRNPLCDTFGGRLVAAWEPRSKKVSKSLAL